MSAYLENVMRCLKRNFNSANVFFLVLNDYMQLPGSYFHKRTLFSGPLMYCLMKVLVWYLPFSKPSKALAVYRILWLGDVYISMEHLENRSCFWWLVFVCAFLIWSHIICFLIYFVFAILFCPESPVWYYQTYWLWSLSGSWHNGNIFRLLPLSLV